MNLKEVKKYLINCYEKLNEGAGEAALEAINEKICEYPESLSIFLDLFEKESLPLRKETLSQIIISHISHDASIDFLKKRGWEESDFEGFKGLVGKKDLLR